MSFQFHAYNPVKREENAETASFSSFQSTKTKIQAELFLQHRALAMVNTEFLKKGEMN